MINSIRKENLESDALNVIQFLGGGCKYAARFSVTLEALNPACFFPTRTRMHCNIPPLPPPPRMCTAARLGIGHVTCVKECWEIDADRSRKQKAAFGPGADAFGASQAGSETTPRAASVWRRIYQRTTRMPERSILGQHPSSTMLPTALLPPPTAPRSPPSAHLMQRKRLFCRRCCSTEVCCCAV